MNIVQDNAYEDTRNLISSDINKANNTLEFNIKTPENINMSFYSEFREAYIGKKELFKNYVIDFSDTKKMQSCVFGMLLQLHEYKR